MISREWLTTYLAARLTRARVHVERPVIPMAEDMTGELLERWLEGEAAFWLSASGKRGLTPGQRGLRTQVGRFYEQRLAAHRAVSRGSGRDEEET